MSTPLPTQALDAEVAILAAMLNAPKVINEAKYLLSSADFYQPRHQVLFEAICELAETGAVVDPVLVLNHLNRMVEGQERQTYLDKVGGAPYLHTVFAATFTAINVEHYAEQITNAGRMRSIVEIGDRLHQIGGSRDVDHALDAAAVASLELQLVVDAPKADVVRGHYKLNDFLSIADHEDDWVVPNLIAQQDALMFLGGEGAGKSTLLRQFALCVACGINPLRPNQAIPPRKAMLLDVENAESSLRRGLRTMSHNVAKYGLWKPENLELLARPGGMNLRKREDRLVIERIISDFRPSLIVAGPLYKLAPRGHDDWDTAAAEAREVLDKWREKYGVAYVLEHHMPKGDGLSRPPTPFGGSEWMRWVTHGRVLKEIPGSYLYELLNFRSGDREPRDIPLGFSRAGLLPWNPIWDPAEINAAKGYDPDGKPMKALR